MGAVISGLMSKSTRIVILETLFPVQFRFSVIPFREGKRSRPL